MGRGTTLYFILKGRLPLPAKDPTMNEKTTIIKVQNILNYNLSKYFLIEVMQKPLTNMF